MSYLRNSLVDQISGLGSGTHLKTAATLILSCIFLVSPAVQGASGEARGAGTGPTLDAVLADTVNRTLDRTAGAAAVQEKPAWAKKLEQKLKDIDEAHLGELGVYIKDLKSGTVVSLRGDESWYLASGIKVPVAIAVLRDIEMGEFDLDTEVHLVESDYVDGAGETNWHGPGSRLSVRYLMEQMITRSDNTATDMLIRLVGLEQVNHILRELVPQGFGDITTLADVRRHAYSGFHPDAFQLTGKDFFILKKQSEERQRIAALAEVLGVSTDDLAVTDMDSAFAAYYATNLNGGTLSAYGKLLQTLVSGQALRPASTDYLVGLLKQVKTGERRIKAGLPDTVTFAHKTGTQHLRICDLGVSLLTGPETAQTSRTEQVGGTGSSQPSGVVIAACNRSFPSLSAAEAALRAVGQAVAASGILDDVEIRNVAENRSP